MSLFCLSCLCFVFCLFIWLNYSYNLIAYFSFVFEITFIYYLYYASVVFSFASASSFVCFLLAIFVFFHIIVVFVNVFGRLYFGPLYNLCCLSFLCLCIPYHIFRFLHTYMRGWFRQCGGWFRQCGGWFRQCGDWFRQCGAGSVNAGGDSNRLGLISSSGGRFRTYPFKPNFKPFRVSERGV